MPQRMDRVRLLMAVRNATAESTPGSTSCEYPGSIPGVSIHLPFNLQCMAVSTPVSTPGNTPGSTPGVGIHLYTSQQASFHVYLAIIYIYSSIHL